MSSRGLPASDIQARSTHPDRRVRQQLAEACESLPDPEASAALAVLLKDKSHYVRERAQLSAERRAVQRTKRARSDEQSQTLQDVLQSMEDDYDAEARARTEFAISLAKDELVSAQRHETDTIHSTLEQQLIAYEREARKDSPNQEKLIANAVGARASQKRLMDVMKATTSLTQVLKPKFANTSMATIVENAFALVRIALASQVGELDLRAEVEEALAADLDTSAMEQALRNLVKNAAEAYDPPSANTRGPHRFVRITARSSGAANVEIVVEDRGFGMDEEHVEAMFKPFGSKKENGQGIGMLVVQKMVREMHGGSLDVRSTPGEGTTVTLSLPTKQRGAARLKGTERSKSVDAKRPKNSARARSDTSSKRTKK